MNFLDFINHNRQKYNFPPPLSPRQEFQRLKKRMGLRARLRWNRRLTASKEKSRMSRLMFRQVLSAKLVAFDDTD